MKMSDQPNCKGVALMYFLTGFMFLRQKADQTVGRAKFREKSMILIKNLDEVLINASVKSGGSGKL